MNKPRLKDRAVENKPSDKTLRIKWVISSLACSALVLRLVLPELKIDSVSVALFAIAILPWLQPLIKSAELPGGVKIEFQDVKSAAERVTAGEESSAVQTDVKSMASYLSIVGQDPALAMVALRIEIEKRLRQLAKLSGLKSSRPLPQIAVDLREAGVLSKESAGGLLDLIAIGNQAAHGVAVASDVAYSATEYGPRVLQVLDAKIREHGENG